MIEHADTGKSRLSRQRDIEIFALVLILTYLALCMFGITPYTKSYKLNLLYNAGIYILVLLPSLIAFLLQGKSIKKLFTTVKGQAKVILALILFRGLLELVLYLVKYYELYPATLPDKFYLILHFIYYLVIVGAIEEFVYRIYIQGTLEELFGKLSFLAPLISGVIFGVSHALNNNLQSALLNIFIGLVWGYVRYFSKKATFTALVVNHAISNIMVELVSVVYGLL